MKWIKKHIVLLTLIIIAIMSVITDIIFESNITIFNEVNKILFSLVSVIAGFWVTCYLLFLQMYKDRYPLTLVENKYLPQMKYNMTYIVYCIIFGCWIITKGGGVLQNIWYATSALYTVFIVLKHIYDTSKTLMLNTYIDDFCKEISEKLENKENCVQKGAFKSLRYVLDECVVKEEYYVVQNISIKLGNIFREFLKNSVSLLDYGEDRKSVEDSFERIVNIGVYQLELCKDINSELIVDEISSQQIKNIKFCIEINHYEWFKKYTKQVIALTFDAQEKGEDKVVAELFSIYTSILSELIKEEKMEWIKYMLNKLFSMTMSLNFLSSNINLKYFASLVVYGLLHCEQGDLYDYLYEVFEKFTSVACRINKGFRDIKVYYALYFNDILQEKNEKLLKRFLDTIFQYDQDRGNDTTWTEFKFYCIKEIQENKEEIKEIDVNKYHIKLLVEVIEMKEYYNGYMFLPKFEEMLDEVKNTKAECEKICEHMEFLINKCIINDNLNFFFVMLKKVNTCMVNTEARNKDLQLTLFDLFVWMITRTKRLNNKQFNEMIFSELEDILNELDKKRAISKDFGDKIVVELTDLAKYSDSDSHSVVLQVIELFSNFLRENKELYFVHNYPERKEKLYKGIFNIATVCVENDFEEGVRRCSNTIGWFTIYSIKQGNTRLTRYLIKLAKGMLEISRDMNVSTKTQAFLLTLFTTVGMYCCKESINYIFIDNILEAIHSVDKELVFTAIKIRTYENDMWDSLLDQNTQQLANKFKKKYEDYQKRK